MCEDATVSEKAVVSDGHDADWQVFVLACARVEDPEAEEDFGAGDEDGEDY